jgi:hypothetical protein
MRHGEPLGRTLGARGPTMQYHVELMMNGLVRVYDRACGWAACYRLDGTYAHGATDSPAYRKAALDYIKAVRG